MFYPSGRGQMIQVAPNASSLRYNVPSGYNGYRTPSYSSPSCNRNAFDRARYNSEFNSQYGPLNTDPPPSGHHGGGTIGN